MKRISLAVLAALACLASAQAAPLPTITLLPSDGDVGGAPGSVVGWGFTLVETAPSDWVVLTGSEFTGSQVFGTYVDYLSLPNAPLYVAGPAPESLTVMAPWDGSSNPPLGVGEFDINPTAAPGTGISGNLVVHYSLFSQDPNDPNFDPDTSTVVADATLSNAVDITVAPEPSSLLLVATALVTLPLLGSRRRLARQ